MKMFIKFLILFAILFVIGLINKSCTKDNKNNANSLISGNVVGYIFDKCACCPGWLIENGNDTLKFETVPENDLLWDLVNFYGYPVEIEYSYKNSEDFCSQAYKIMTSIKFNLDEGCTTEGLIVSYDDTECGCCGGWIIETANDTIKVSRLPIESKVLSIVEEQGFPIPVKLEYIDIIGSCEDFYKEVICFTIEE